MIFTSLVFALLPQQADATPAYDPLRLAAPAPASRDFVVHDAQRQREVPVRVWLPTAAAPAPVVLWSHGLGGSRENSAYLAEHWCGRGYVVVYLQHPGSDESVWRDAGRGERLGAMQKAASGANLVLRCGDVVAVLDQLAAWNVESSSPLHGRLDLEHVGMSGHSFGAVTTQAVAGQRAPAIGARFTDARIDAALPMSPSVPKAGDPARAFGGVGIPWMLMTGTEDRSPIGDIDVADRLAVYPALPSTIDRYELVLQGADHGVFGQRAIGRGGDAKAAHHRTILALSTAFWDAQLRGDAAARDWLHGDGARQALGVGDRWQVGAKAGATAR